MAWEPEGERGRRGRRRKGRLAERRRRQGQGRRREQASARRPPLGWARRPGGGGGWPRVGRQARGCGHGAQPPAHAEPPPPPLLQSASISGRGCRGTGCSAEPAAAPRARPAPRPAGPVGADGAPPAPAQPAQDGDPRAQVGTWREGRSGGTGDWRLSTCRPSLQPWGGPGARPGGTEFAGCWLPGQCVCGEVRAVPPCLPGLQPPRGLEREVGRLWAGGYCWDERLLGAGLPGWATLFFETFLPPLWRPGTPWISVSKLQML